MRNVRLPFDLCRQILIDFDQQIPPGTKESCSASGRPTRVAAMRSLLYETDSGNKPGLGVEKCTKRLELDKPGALCCSIEFEMPPKLISAEHASISARRSISQLPMPPQRLMQAQAAHHKARDVRANHPEASLLGRNPPTKLAFASASDSTQVETFE